MRIILQVKHHQIIKYDTKIPNEMATMISFNHHNFDYIAPNDHFPPHESYFQIRYRAVGTLPGVTVEKSIKLCNHCSTLYIDLLSDGTSPLNGACFLPPLTLSGTPTPADTVVTPLDSNQRWTHY